MTAALLNHLWQSSLFAVAAAAIALALRRNQARVRFWVWMAASLKFLVPFALLADAGHALARLLPWQPAAHAAAVPVLSAVAQPYELIVLLPSEAAPARAAGHLPWILLAAWAGGAAVLAALWLRRWLELRRIARAATPARIAGAEAYLTDAAIEPGQFGIVSPRLLLPRGIGERLGAAELAAVIAHESCHARRRDNLWSALHMLVETAFWFHPFVWMIGARLIAERERACDEAVLASGGDRAAYAGGLLQVCRYYLESPLACAAGLSGGELKQRVRSILDGAFGRRLSRGRQAFLALAGAAALLGPLAAGALAPQATLSPAPKAFDAASIKPAPPPAAGPRRVMRIGFRTTPGRLAAENVTLLQLIQNAYNLKPFQVEGPEWLMRDGGQRFNLQAETSQPLDGRALLDLLQPFLVKQFDLKFHRTTKDVKVYELVAVPGANKLKPDPDAPPPPPPGPDGAPGPPGSRQLYFRMGLGQNGLTMQGPTDMARFTDMLSNFLDRPIVDKTGLTATYDVKLNFAPTGLGPAGAKIAMARMNGQSVPTDTAPSIFSALPNQLGLKLIPAKAPLIVMVVDHVIPQPLGS